jgi:hypothetical protein
LLNTPISLGKLPFKPLEDQLIKVMYCDDASHIIPGITLQRSPREEPDLGQSSFHPRESRRIRRAARCSSSGGGMGKEGRKEGWMDECF